MAMEGSHINKKCVHPRAHHFILLSKMTKFSPKKVYNFADKTRQGCLSHLALVRNRPLA